MDKSHIVDNLQGFPISQLLATVLVSWFLHFPLLVGEVEAESYPTTLVTEDENDEIC